MALPGLRPPTPRVGRGGGGEGLTIVRSRSMWAMPSTDPGLAPPPPAPLPPLPPLPSPPANHTATATAPAAKINARPTAPGPLASPGLGTAALPALAFWLPFPARLTALAMLIDKLRRIFDPINNL